MVCAVFLKKNLMFDLSPKFVAIVIK